MKSVDPTIKLAGPEINQFSHDTTPGATTNFGEWDKIFIRARELIHEHTGRALPIAVTEFNSAYAGAPSGEATPDSHYNAIWMADVLGSMIKNGVSISADPDLSVYAARRPDSALTIMIINLSVEQKTQPLQIGDQTTIQAEM